MSLFERLKEDRRLISRDLEAFEHASMIQWHLLIKKKSKNASNTNENMSNYPYKWKILRKCKHNSFKRSKNNRKKCLIWKLQRKINN